MRSSWKRCRTRVRSFNGTWKITLLLSEEGFKGKVEVRDELSRSSEIFGWGKRSKDLFAFTILAKLNQVPLMSRTIWDIHLQQLLVVPLSWLQPSTVPPLTGMKSQIIYCVPVSRLIWSWVKRLGNSWRQRGNILMRTRSDEGWRRTYSYMGRRKRVKNMQQVQACSSNNIQTSHSFSLSPPLLKPPHLSNIHIHNPNPNPSPPPLSHHTYNLKYKTVPTTTLPLLNSSPPHHPRLPKPHPTKSTFPIQSRQGNSHPYLLPPTNSSVSMIRRHSWSNIK